MYEKTDYICIHIQAEEATRETLVAWLGTLGFESFEETDSHLNAYIPQPAYDEAATRELLGNQGLSEDSFSSELVKARNWNAEWEAAYESVEIGDFCQIVPSFHAPRPGFEYTIHLDPKMSFGTGHHETTRIMVQQMQNLNFQGAAVLDMGCGTGVLGILAAKLGSREVLGIDIDPWSAENGLENARRNGVEISILLGDASAIPSGGQYDIILANINLNVLLQDVPAYVAALKPGGTLVVSGFLEKDHSRLLQAFSLHPLKPGRLIQENRWLSLCFDKTSA